MANYMRLSDFFIGKPGNVSVSEALAMGLPIITECALTTMSQEKYCAQCVKNNGMGSVVSSFKHVRSAVVEMIQPAKYQRFKQKVSAFDNQAVFEVAELLENILLESILKKDSSAPSSLGLNSPTSAPIPESVPETAQGTERVSTVV